MSAQGWYYLHENGELIYKPSPDAIQDIRDSNFCRAAWAVDGEDREQAWRILVESLSLGAIFGRVKELADKWGCADEDADVYAERIGVVLTLDGDQWCATRTDFVNLQESPAGFGSTKLAAMAQLCYALGFKADKLGWGATFKDLLKQ